MDDATRMRGLLARGLVCGLLAGVVAFLVARLLGEGPINRAIAFEDAAAAGHGDTPLVSRALQSTLGLLTGTAVYAVAVGGVFALVFAAVHGRIGRAQPRTTAAVLAVAAFVVLVLVPFAKYPSNPPAVGADDTIGFRTRVFFAMLAISIAAALAALRLGRDTVRRLGPFYGTLAAVAAYVALVAVAGVLLPPVDEMPRGFPATVVWDFRTATLATHAAVWLTLGLGFGALAQRWLSGPAAGGTYRTSSPSPAAPRP